MTDNPLEKHSDGKPIDLATAGGLKTNYKDPKKRYELAERLVWSKLPDWRRKIIIDCKTNRKDDRVFDEYLQEIIRTAENDSLALPTDLPPAPEYAAEEQLT